MSRTKKITARPSNANVRALDLLLRSKPGNKPDIFVGIPVAAHQEDPSQVIHTLSLIKQQTYSDHNYRVYLLLNSPHAEYDNENFEAIRSAVAEFAEQNPNFPLTVFQTPFTNGAPIGKIRATLWDQIVLEAQGAPGRISHTKIGVNFDIDMIDLSPTYLETKRKTFDDQPEISASVGCVSWGLSEKFIQEVIKIATDLDAPSQTDFIRCVLILQALIDYQNASDFLQHAGGDLGFEAAGSFRLNKMDLVGGIKHGAKLREVMNLLDTVSVRSGHNLERPRAIANIMSKLPDVGSLSGDQVAYDYRRQMHGISMGMMPFESFDLWLSRNGHSETARQPNALALRIRRMSKQIINDASDFVYRCQYYVDSAACMAAEKFRYLGHHDFADLIQNQRHELFEAAQVYMFSLLAALYYPVELNQHEAAIKFGEIDPELHLEFMQAIHDRTLTVGSIKEMLFEETCGTNPHSEIPTTLDADIRYTGLCENASGAVLQRAISI